MEETSKAFYQFYNSFGIPAFVEYNVPSKSSLPYITYTLEKEDFLQNGLQQVRVWYKSTSFKEINIMVDKILNKIGDACRLPLKNGQIVIYKGSPLVQYQPSDDESIKIAYINLEISYLFN